MTKRIDWKRVAAARLSAMREHESWRVELCAELESYILRALGNALHARCIGNSEALAGEIAHDVARKIIGK